MREVLLIIMAMLHDDSATNHITMDEKEKFYEPFKGVGKLLEENDRLKELNAELLAALKDATGYMLKTGNLYPAQAYVKLIAKAAESK